MGDLLREPITRARYARQHPSVDQVSGDS